MAKREDIRKILIIGSGPIIIGQACEFDYSGTQACKTLREEGYEVVLVNSNPATIMTDPETAPRTYIEPLAPEYIEKMPLPQCVLLGRGKRVYWGFVYPMVSSGTVVRFYFTSTFTALLPWRLM